MSYRKSTSNSFAMTIFYPASTRVRLYIPQNGRIQGHSQLLEVEVYHGVRHLGHGPVLAHQKGQQNQQLAATRESAHQREGLARHAHASPHHAEGGYQLHHDVPEVHLLRVARHVYVLGPGDAHDDQEPQEPDALKHALEDRGQFGLFIFLRLLVFFIHHCIKHRAWNIYWTRQRQDKAS